MVKHGNIAVMDLVHGKEGHISFNRLLLLAICNAVGSNIIHGYFLTKHINAQKSNFEYSNFNIEFTPIRRITFFNIYKAYRDARKKRVKRFIFLAADNFYIPFLLSLLSLLFFKKLSINVILHNNVNKFAQDRVGFVLWRLADLLGINITVLSDYVKESMLKMGFKNINVLPHPVYSDLPKVRSLLNEKDKVKDIDFLVLGRHAFNLDWLKNLVTQDAVLKRKAIVACLHRSECELYQSSIDFKYYEKPLSETDYWSLVSRSRFIVIPPSSGNRLTASGVLIDAISMAVPVLAPQFGVFNKEISGTCRSLLYNENDCQNVFSRALDTDDEKYRTYQTELLNRHTLLDIKATTLALKSLFFN